MEVSKETQEDVINLHNERGKIRKYFRECFDLDVWSVNVYLNR